MKHNSMWSGIGAFIGILILILDGKTALEGATNGIDLCLNAVVPSLFPFFMLSILLNSALMGGSLKLLRPLGNLFGLPEGMEGLLIPSFLGGYPMGAQAIAEAYRSDLLSKADAERMLGFCNNCGPAFLFGMAISLFPEKWMAFVLWGIHIFSAMITSVFLAPKTAIHRNLPKGLPISLSCALSSAIRITAKVCGWVVLFRILITFLFRWFLWLLPETGPSIIIGILELSNGCYNLIQISDISIRFILCSGMLSFGGLCVMMQTASVVSGLSLRYYCLGKLLQTVFSLILSATVTSGHWILSLPILVTILLKTQNNSSIRLKAGV